MGVIRSQTIKGTAFIYIGAVLGLATNLILPRYLLEEEIGLINLLLSYSIIFAQVANLGFDNVTIRLFPYFRDEKNSHNGFLFILGTVLTIGLLLSLTAFFILQPYIVSPENKSFLLFSKYSFYIIPLIIFTLLFNSFDAYSRVLYKSVRGSFLKEFLQRVLILLTIGISFLFSFNFDKFLFTYILCITVPAVVLLWLIGREKQLNFKPVSGFVSPKLRKEMFSVSTYGIVAVFSSSIIVSIDKIMIQEFLDDLFLLGVYSIVFYFGTLITMPSRALTKISSTILAEAWKNDDIKTVKDVYYKSCITQMIFSALLFIGIWANIDNVFIILPKSYEIGKYVIFWICLGSFIDMSTGVNNSIIATSKYYKAQTIFMIIFVLIVIVSNYLLIPVLGIVGAAVASAISLFLFNLMRWIFLWYRFNLQPFNYRYLIVLLFAIIAFIPGYYLPKIDPFYIDIVIRSGIIFIIFCVLIYFFKLSEDINNRVDYYLTWIGVKKAN